MTETETETETGNDNTKTETEPNTALIDAETEIKLSKLMDKNLLISYAKV